MAGWHVPAKAEGVKNGLDPDGVKAAALRLGVEVVHRRVQKGKDILHLCYVGAELNGDVFCIAGAIEAGADHGVVVLRPSGTQGAQQGDE